MSKLNIWAVVGENPEEEGICGILGPDGWTPLVIMHERNLPMIAKTAAELARMTGRKTRVVKFVEVDE